MTKTLTIRDEVYNKLLTIKREGESFSELFERLADGSDPYAPIETLHRKLTRPLHARVFHDTDPRTSKGWVVPILVEPFDEGVEGAIGGGA